MSFPRSPFPARTGASEAHTLGHIDCPACERSRTTVLSCISCSLKFSVAAQLWLESRTFRAVPGAISARYIRATTEQSYRAYIASLNLFFADLPLEKIHLGHLRQYQEARVAGAPPFIRFRRPQDAKPRKLPDGTVLPAKGKQPCPASAKKANQELSVLKMILRRAACWTEEMDEYYERFHEDESEIGRALSPEDQRRWLDVSRLKERWSVIHWYSQLAFATGMATNEIRSLRLGDVNLQQQIVSVPPLGAKNRYRVRTIPLTTAEAQWALEKLLVRAYHLGSRDPHHYLFPLCLGRSKGPRDGSTLISVYDPLKPMTVSGLKKPWEEVRQASGLTSFRPYDTRHTALTRWAEGGMDIAALMSLAGHVSVRMMRHYARISEQVKRRALISAMGHDQPHQHQPRYSVAAEHIPAPLYPRRAAGW